MAIELKVPEVGESIREVQIGKWHKKPGDHVKRDEDVVEIETDKASVEIPAPESGVISEILKQTGELVHVGDVIGYMELKSDSGTGGRDGGDGKPTRAAESRQGASAEMSAEKSAEKQESEGSKSKPKSKSKSKSHSKAESKSKSGAKSKSKSTGKTEKSGAASSASSETEQDSDSTRDSDGATIIMPAAKRLLAEHDLDPEEISATGPGGRLLKEDVQRHLADLEAGSESTTDAGSTSAEERRISTSSGNGQGTAVSPVVESDLEEVVPMSLIRRRIAERLVQAQHEAALLTTFNEIDMSAVIALRKTYQEFFTKKHGVKLGFMSFFVKGMIDALQAFPELNAEIRDQSIVYRNYYHIGIAIGGGKGLVVPVLRHAERMSFAEIEMGIADFGNRARENRIKPEELMGGTFTISNGGIYGSLLSTPIVNPPQSGVLGMHTIQERPVAHQGQVVIRPMMYIALTYDHRIVDGQGAVSCLKRLKDVLEDPARILLEA